MTGMLLEADRTVLREVGGRQENLRTELADVERAVVRGHEELKAGEQEW